MIQGLAVEPAPGSEDLDHPKTAAVPDPDTNSSDRPKAAAENQGLAPEPEEQVEEPDASQKPGGIPQKEDAKPDERRLKFSFRQQRWVDVLEWLAEQADLSLVLDAPPPGSFNYTDNREYSPTEAIDLVNGVLVAKGYTLVRRERMLIVVNLTAGLPRTLVPRVSLDELEERGRFEMVSVAFPIGRRDMTTITTEIKTLLGPYGEIAPMPASSQILVTDRAGVMRTIGAVIESVPEPPLPQKPPEPPKPKEKERPELRVYSLDGADPKATIETLEALIESAKFVYDPEADHMNAYATPSQHAAIESLVNQMRGDTPEGRRPRLEVYPMPQLEGVRLESILESLPVIAPSALTRLDEMTNQLFVWAKPADHETIRAAIVKLIQVDQLGGQRSIKVFTLQRADPAPLSELLKTALPNVRVTVDPLGRRMIVQAAEKDLEVVEKVIQQFDAEPPSEQLPVLRVYPVDRRLVDRVTPLIKGLAPEAELTLDPKLGRVTIVAPARIHERVEPMLAALKEAAVELPEAKVQVHRIPKVLHDRFESVRTFISEQVPNAKLLWEPRTLELTVWANSEDQARIRDLLDQLQIDAPTEAIEETIEIYQVPKALQNRFEQIRTLLTDQVPHAKLIWDEKTRELTVWALPEDQASIHKLLRQLDREGPVAALDETIEVYKIPRALRDRFASVQPLLTQQVPDAKIFWDTEKLELTVWALPDDHTIVQQLLEQLGKEPPAKESRRMVAYPINLSDLTAAVEMLKKVAPEAQILPDTRKRCIMVWATDEEQEAVEEAVRGMNNGQGDVETRSYMSHPVMGMDMTLAVKLLTESFPGISFEQDPIRKRLIVLATDSEHEQIAKKIREIQAAPKEDANRHVVVYAIDRLSSDSVASVLTELIPGAHIVTKPYSPNVSVRGTDEEHAVAKTIIDQWVKNTKEPTEPVATVYTLEHVKAADLIIQLKQLMPTTGLVEGAEPNTILARATAEEHALLRQFVEAADQPATGRGDVLAIYQIPSDKLETFRGLLDTRMTKEMYMVSAGRNQIIVRAPANVQERVKELVDQFGPVVAGKPTVKVYRLRNMDPTNLTAWAAMLKSIAPDAQVVPNLQQRRVLVWAVDEEHQAIQQALQDMEGEQDDTEPRTFRSHPVQGMEIALAAQLLADTFPNVSFEQDTTRDRLIAHATAAEHEEISSTIREIQAPPEEDANRHVVVYPADRLTSEAIANVLTDLLPGAHVVARPYTPNVSVRGTDEEHALAKTVVDQWEEHAEEPTQQVATMYPLQHVRAAEMIPQLKQLIPSAALVEGADPNTILARATAEEHEQLKEFLDAADQPTSEQDDIMAVYPLPSDRLESLRGLLDERLANRMQIVAAGRERVIVRAPQEVQDRVRELVDQLGPIV
ncbi:MAG: hypothetical protein JW829_06330, partial [Pirellulales bacterium]|nr:hypothetical protein [Pirellulales bacterium]